MTHRSRKSNSRLPPIDELPRRGVEPAPAPARKACGRCKDPSDIRGPVTKHWCGYRWWWLHPVCAEIVKAEIARCG